MVPAPLFLAERQLAERVSLMLKEVSMSRTRLVASLTAMLGCLVFAGALVVWWFPLKVAAHDLASTHDLRRQLDQAITKAKDCTASDHGCSEVGVAGGWILDQ